MPPNTHAAGIDSARESQPNAGWPMAPDATISSENNAAPAVSTPESAAHARKSSLGPWPQSHTGGPSSLTVPSRARYLSSEATDAKV